MLQSPIGKRSKLRWEDIIKRDVEKIGRRSKLEEFGN
jgi:hypothetical protein